MNWYGLLQSILTYSLTTFAVAVATWAAKTSKRITKLEEHELMTQQQLAALQSEMQQQSVKLDAVITTQVTISTKLDLLLNGRLIVQGMTNDKRMAD